jgi:hypothetical protein
MTSPVASTNAAFIAPFDFSRIEDRSTLKYSLAAADVHWISLKPQLEGLIVPSKFYGVAAAGRAIVAITAKNGEIAQLVEQNGCGVVVEPGDAWARPDSHRFVGQSRTGGRNGSTRTRNVGGTFYTSTSF